MQAILSETTEKIVFSHDAFPAKEDTGGPWCSFRIQGEHSDMTIYFDSVRTLELLADAANLAAVDLRKMKKHGRASRHRQCDLR